MNVCRNKNRVFLLACLWLVGCFKNPGQEVAPKSVELPITPVYLSSSDSYLRASGGCQGNGGFTITYSSALTSSQTVEVICADNIATTNLLVQNGTSNQTFTVEIVSKLKGRKSKPITVTVSYSPPLSVSGLAVLSGGSRSTNGGTIEVTPSIGQPFSPVRTTNGTAALDTGLVGVNTY